MKYKEKIMIKLSKKSVRFVAESLIKEAYSFNTQYGYSCIYCWKIMGKFSNDPESVKHTINCPVIEAREILEELE